MPVVVTGKTFDIRDRLKSLGGRWNAEHKGWEFYGLSQEHRKEFSKRVGVIIVDKPGDPIPVWQGPEVKPRQSIKEILEAVLAGSTDGKHKTVIVGNDASYFNYFADQNPAVYFGFSDVGSMVKHIEQIPNDMQNGSGWENGNADFCGTDCMEKAIRLFADGWPEGVALAETIAEQLLGSNAIQRRRKYSTSGGLVNVGRLLAGNPAHMIARPKQHGKKIVTLFISVTMNAGIKATNAIARAAAVAAVSDILEINGYSCEIVAIDTTHDYSTPISQIAVKIKDAGESLNINEAIFAMGHPSFLRRFCFALVGSRIELRDIWSSMGTDGVVFNDDVQPKSNEFYFDHLTMITQKQIGQHMSDVEKACEIIKICSHKNLPITINREGFET